MREPLKFRQMRELWIEVRVRQERSHLLSILVYVGMILSSSRVSQRCRSYSRVYSDTRMFLKLSSMDYKELFCPIMGVDNWITHVQELRSWLKLWMLSRRRV